MANFGDKETFDSREASLTLDDPKYNGKNITNRVLVRVVNAGFRPEEEDKKQKESYQNKYTQKLKGTYYVPCYIWAKFMNLNNIEHRDLQAQINVTLNIVINIKNIPLIVKDKILQKLILRFNRDDAINLGDEEMLEITRKQIQPDIKLFTVRKVLKAGMVGDVVLTPFQELLGLTLSVSLQELEIPREDVLKIKIDFQKNQKLIKSGQQQQNRKEQEEKTYAREDISQIQDFESFKVMFNCMETDRKNFQLIDYGKENDYGSYTLAQQLLKVEYSNSEIATIVKENSENFKEKYNRSQNFGTIQEFSYAHFIFYMYKHPLVAICTIFLPLSLLGMINIGIFFQDNGLADRLGTLAGLMIALVALLPVIREQIPPFPNLAFVEYLVYLKTINSLFCFAESINVRNEDEGWQFQWQTSVLFWLTLAIQLIQLVLIAALWIRFCKKEKDYRNKEQKKKKQGFKQESYKKWYNQKCDEHFMRKIDSGQIQILALRNQRIRKPKQNKEKENGKGRQMEMEII